MGVFITSTYKIYTIIIVLLNSKISFCFLILQLFYLFHYLPSLFEVYRVLTSFNRIYLTRAYTRKCSTLILQHLLRARVYHVLSMFCLFYSMPIYFLHTRKKFARIVDRICIKNSLCALRRDIR